MTKDDQSRPVLKYIGFFAAAYCILYLTVSILLSILVVHMGSIYYSIIFGAASVPVYLFRKENGRMYTQTEKRKLIIGTFLSALIIDSVIATHGAMPVMRSGYAFIGFQIFNSFILWYIFGPLSKGLYKSTDRS
jgi:hypothetical protein